MFLVGTKHVWNVLRKVLTVCVQSDGVSEAHLQSFLEALFQGIAFAGILGAGNDRDSLDLLQDFECSVGRAITDNNHIEAVCEGTMNHIGDGSGIVVCRNHHADASVAKCLFTFH